jgi:serine/threonine-protein kinase HipA
MSRISSCLDAAGNVLLSRKQAIDVVESQLRCIIEHWDAVGDEASLTEIDPAFLWRRQFLNPYALEDLDGDAAHLTSIAGQGGS